MTNNATALQLAQSLSAALQQAVDGADTTTAAMRRALAITKDMEGMISAAMKAPAPQDQPDAVRVAASPQDELIEDKDQPGSATDPDAANLPMDDSAPQDQSANKDRPSRGFTVTASPDNAPASQPALFDPKVLDVLHRMAVGLRVGELRVELRNLSFDESH